MKSRKINSLKRYKDNLETYISDILETASESDIKKTLFKNETKS